MLKGLSQAVMDAVRAVPRHEFVPSHAREQADAERLSIQADAAKRATEIWLGLEKNSYGKSEYLSRKKVKPYGVRFSRGSIVVPVGNIENKLVGLQFIYADGSKKFLTGTAKRGAFHIVGDLQRQVDVTAAESPAPSFVGSKVLCIAEGYATAASIHMATGWTCVVAFDAGNLKPVAEVLRGAFPKIKIIICCDDDSAKADTGLIKGEEAAKAVGGCFVLPDFSNIAGASR